MEPSSSTSGSAIHGQLFSSPCLLQACSSFPLLWLHTYGVLNGPLGGSNSHDNESVVVALSSGTSRNAKLMAFDGVFSVVGRVPFICLKGLVCSDELAL